MVSLSNREIVGHVEHRARRASPFDKLRVRRSGIPHGPHPEPVEALILSLSKDEVASRMNPETWKPSPMKTSDADILLIPGYDGSGDEHWQRRWASKLSTARVVEQADWRFGALDVAVETIVAAVREATRPVILVAHSAGVPLTLHAVRRLAALGLADRVRGAFLVSPPQVDKLAALEGVDPALARYSNEPLPFPSVVAASTDDPFTDVLSARNLALDLGADFSDAGEAGHINVASGHGPWPEGILRFAGFLKTI
jgi:hypothetical protein